LYQGTAAVEPQSQHVLKGHDFSRAANIQSKQWALAPEGLLKGVRYMTGKDQKDDSRWIRAAFCIYGETLQPDEINKDLGVQATNSGLKGQRQSKYPRARPLRTSIWILDSPLDDHLPLKDHLKWLLDTLEPKLDVVRGIAKQYDAKLSCGYSSEHGQGGSIFDVTLLERLAKLRVPLVLDLYPPSPITLDSSQD
jgi:Domain of unknown function (DUF4279)